MNAQKQTTEQFIQKAQAAHGLGKYDYSQTVYTRSTDKLDIVCPQHGLFRQEANSHLRGAGCRACASEVISQAKRFGLAEFINKARTVHGDRYDYSQIAYRSNTTKVIIICPAHGAFKQQPNNHWQGQGCPACGRAKADEARRKSLSDFLVLFRMHHGSRYDYSQSIYKGSKEKIVIICSKHGAFEQMLESHAEGKGCAKCAAKQRGRYGAVETQDFITRANKIHNFKYLYTETRYKKGTVKVGIICPEHGFFLQKPGSHLMGHGCFECGERKKIEAARLSWIERANGRRATLYFLKLFNDFEEFYKVGITCKSIAERYVAKGALNGYAYEIIAQHSSTDPARIYEWEQSILETFAHLRYTPKTHFPGATECFSSADEILVIFPL